jgi:hypothetical protein
LRQYSAYSDQIGIWSLIGLGELVMAHSKRVGLLVLISLAAPFVFSIPADAQSSLRKEISDLKKRTEIWS